MQSCWGRLVEEEPQDHYGYSNDYRPDVTAPGLGRGGKRLVGDVKFKDPLSSNPIASAMLMVKTTNTLQTRMMQ